MKPNSGARKFWILGNKAHPDGHIVPDKYKSGVHVIEKSAYNDLALKLADAEKLIMNLRESTRVRKLMVEADKLVEASERLLERIDHNAGIGEYKGGPAFVVEPLRKLVTEYRKFREKE